MNKLYLIILFLCCTLMAMGQGRIQRPHKQHKKVEISKPDGYINGYGFVDLGLPSGTKWATCNLGSSSPTQIGNFYSWGETSPKQVYSVESYSLSNSILNEISGNKKYDAATQLMGQNWRMPTHKQWIELDKECIFTPVVFKGKHGIMVEGPNRRTIFFPTSGVMNQHGHVNGLGERSNQPFQNNYEESVAIFWSSTECLGNIATSIIFFTRSKNPSMIDISYIYPNKWIGYQIRPVCLNSN